MTIQQILSEAPFSMATLARETGLSYNTVRAWSVGRRRPDVENLKKLATYLDGHGQQLQSFAAEVRALIEN